MSALIMPGLSSDLDPLALSPLPEHSNQNIKKSLFEASVLDLSKVDISAEFGSLISDAQHHDQNFSSPYSLVEENKSLATWSPKRSVEGHEDTFTLTPYNHIEDPHGVNDLFISSDSHSPVERLLDFVSPLASVAPAGGSSGIIELSRNRDSKNALKSQTQDNSCTRLVNYVPSPLLNSTPLPALRFSTPLTLSRRVLQSPLSPTSVTLNHSSQSLDRTPQLQQKPKQLNFSRRTTCESGLQFEPSWTSTVLPEDLASEHSCNDAAAREVIENCSLQNPCNDSSDREESEDLLSEHSFCEELTVREVSKTEEDSQPIYEEAAENQNDARLSADLSLEMTLSGKEQQETDSPTLASSNTPRPIQRTGNKPAWSILWSSRMSLPPSSSNTPASERRPQPKDLQDDDEGCKGPTESWSLTTEALEGPAILMASPVCLMTSNVSSPSNATDTCNMFSKDDDVDDQNDDDSMGINTLSPRESRSPSEIAMAAVAKAMSRVSQLSRENHVLRHQLDDAQTLISQARQSPGTDLPILTSASNEQRLYISELISQLNDSEVARTSLHMQLDQVKVALQESVEGKNQAIQEAEKENDRAEEATRLYHNLLSSYQRMQLSPPFDQIQSLEERIQDLEDELEMAHSTCRSLAAASSDHSNIEDHLRSQLAAQEAELQELKGLSGLSFTPGGNLNNGIGRGRLPLEGMKQTQQQQHSSVVDHSVQLLELRMTMQSIEENAVKLNRCLLQQDNLQAEDQGKLQVKDIALSFASHATPEKEEAVTSGAYHHTISYEGAWARDTMIQLLQKGAEVERNLSACVEMAVSMKTPRSPDTVLSLTEMNQDRVLLPQGPHQGVSASHQEVTAKDQEVNTALSLETPRAPSTIKEGWEVLHQALTQQHACAQAVELKLQQVVQELDDIGLTAERQLTSFEDNQKKEFHDLQHKLEGQIKLELQQRLELQDRLVESQSLEESFNRQLFTAKMEKATLEDELSATQQRLVGAESWIEVAKSELDGVMLAGCQLELKQQQVDLLNDELSQAALKVQVLESESIVMTASYLALKQQLCEAEELWQSERQRLLQIESISKNDAAERQELQGQLMTMKQALGHQIQLLETTELANTTYQSEITRCQSEMLALHRDLVFAKTSEATSESTLEMVRQQLLQLTLELEQKDIQLQAERSAAKEAEQAVRATVAGLERLQQAFVDLREERDRLFDERNDLLSSIQALQTRSNAELQAMTISRAIAEAALETSRLDLESALKDVSDAQGHHKAELKDLESRAFHLRMERHELQLRLAQSENELCRVKIASVAAEELATIAAERRATEVAALQARIQEYEQRFSGQGQGLVDGLSAEVSRLQANLDEAESKLDGGPGCVGPCSPMGRVVALETTPDFVGLENHQYLCQLQEMINEDEALALKRKFKVASGRNRRHLHNEGGEENSEHNTYAIQADTEEATWGSDGVLLSQIVQRMKVLRRQNKQMAKLLWRLSREDSLLARLDALQTDNEELRLALHMKFDHNEPELEEA